jgi:hypothetical protein
VTWHTIHSLGDPNTGYFSPALSNVTQIKFRVCSNRSTYQAHITSDILGLYLISPRGAEEFAISPNFILTQDITDLRFVALDL